MRGSKQPPASQESKQLRSKQEWRGHYWPEQAAAALGRVLSRAVLDPELVVTYAALDPLSGPPVMEELDNLPTLEKLSKAIECLACGKARGKMASQASHSTTATWTSLSEPGGLPWAWTSPSVSCRRSFKSSSSYCTRIRGHHQSLWLGKAKRALPHPSKDWLPPKTPRDHYRLAPEHTEHDLLRWGHRSPKPSHSLVESSRVGFSPQLYSGSFSRCCVYIRTRSDSKLFDILFLRPTFINFRFSLVSS